MAEYTHFDAEGRPTLVDVSGKSVTNRTAWAEGTVELPESIFDVVSKGNVKKGDKRITYADRQKIEAMERTGAKVTDIAKAVGFHRATIYNELKRGGTPYRAEVAQRSL